MRTDILQGSRTTHAARPRVRLALVSVQIALSLAMLGGSTLLVRSLLSRVQVPLGFETDGVVTMPVRLNVARYPTSEQQAAFFEQLLERVQQVPGVETAALSAAPSPRGVTMSTFTIQVEGQALDPDAPAPAIRVRDATPGYFETFRIPVVRGRAFIEADRRSPEPAVILSESLENLLFGNTDAVGKRIRPDEDDPWHLIVGIARDVRNRDLAQAPQPELYIVRGIGPDQFAGGSAAYVSVRTSGSFADSEAFLKQAVADLDPELPVTIETLDEQVARLTERPRFVAALTGGFTGVALLVAAAGLYGVASYLVTQRTRDIGVRLALGATPGRVSKHLVVEAGRWIAGGSALGLLLMWSTSRLLESQLFGVSPTDGLSIGLALLVLLVALFLALSGPAYRAAHVDPMTALREE